MLHWHLIAKVTPPTYPSPQKAEMTIEAKTINWAIFIATGKWSAEFETVEIREVHCVEGVLH